MRQDRGVPGIEYFILFTDCHIVLELDNPYLAYVTTTNAYAVPFKDYSQIFSFYIKLLLQNVWVHSGLWVSHCWRLCWWILPLFFLLQKKENWDNSGSGHHSTRWDWGDSANIDKTNNFRRIQPCIYPGHQSIWSAATVGLDASSSKAIFTSIRWGDKSSPALPVQLMWTLTF